MTQNSMINDLVRASKDGRLAEMIGGMARADIRYALEDLGGKVKPKDGSKVLAARLAREVEDRAGELDATNELEPDTCADDLPMAVIAAIEADKASPCPTKGNGKAKKEPKATKRYLPATFNGINLPEFPHLLVASELQSLFFAVTGRETKSEDVKHLAWMLMRATREDRDAFLARKRTNGTKTTLAQAWEQGFAAGRDGGLRPSNPFTSIPTLESADAQDR